MVILRTSGGAIMVDQSPGIPSTLVVNSRNPIFWKDYSGSLDPDFL